MSHFSKKLYKAALKDEKVELILSILVNRSNPLLQHIEKFFCPNGVIAFGKCSAVLSLRPLPCRLDRRGTVNSLFIAGLESYSR